MNGTKGWSDAAIRSHVAAIQADPAARFQGACAICVEALNVGYLNFGDKWLRPGNGKRE